MTALRARENAECAQTRTDKTDETQPGEVSSVLSAPFPSIPKKSGPPSTGSVGFVSAQREPFPETQSPTLAEVTPEDWQAYFDERAAIREFDGQMPRSEAEALALEDKLQALRPRPEGCCFFKPCPFDRDTRPVSQGLVLTPCERRFAMEVRRRAAKRDVLYHGTRYASHILASNELRFASSGSRLVSLTRSPEVAVFAGSLPRDDTTEEPAVLILDRRSLQASYRLVPFHAGWEGHGAERDEAEEVVDREVNDVRRHLLDVVRAMPYFLCM